MGAYRILKRHSVSAKRLEPQGRITVLDGHSVDRTMELDDVWTSGFRGLPQHLFYFQRIGDCNQDETPTQKDKLPVDGQTGLRDIEYCTTSDSMIEQAVLSTRR